ncbi:hypothetical protein JL978_17890 [Acinetobacter baumannii]|uniref:hypothetical protein n=1 Tax=Acinetobacter baumannii TaxID=470 RepID=UPI001C467287|nr:hypothetical protein [Acinetobacter baumannii]MBV6578812.1 hypothetical protein [Acinetobacter baumannii]
MAYLIHNTLSSTYTLVRGRKVLSSFLLIAGILGVWKVDTVGNYIIGANLKLPHLFACDIFAM